jgi:hypothetical protein
MNFGQIDFGTIPIFILACMTLWWRLVQKYAFKYGQWILPADGEGTHGVNQAVHVQMETSLFYKRS